MILCRSEFAKKVDSAVFPGMQGGPLDHVIAAKAVALKEAASPEFAEYGRRTIANARALAAALEEHGIALVSGGTDNHMVLADLTPLGIGGRRAETALDAARIYANKNMIPYDERKPMDPSGLRIGAPALTTRGFDEREMRNIGTLIAAVLKNPDDERVLEDARRVVGRLTDAHPIYENLEG
jgi:glycine hydroxymethyltransferase